MPPATQSLEFKDADLAAFYEFYGLNTEPWDGPAGIVSMDARYAACTLDRNGLRPARWMLTSDRHFTSPAKPACGSAGRARHPQGKLAPAR